MDVDKNWKYFLQMNGEDVYLPQQKFRGVVSHTFSSLQPGTEYPFTVITMFFGHNSTAYENFTVTGIVRTLGRSYI